MNKQVQIGTMIDNRQSEFLEEIAKKRHLKVSEVIRQIVNDDMENPDMSAWPRNEMTRLDARFYSEQAAHINMLHEASNLPKTEVIRILIDRAIAKNKDTTP